MGMCRECYAAIKLKAKQRGYKNCPECGRDVGEKPTLPKKFKMTTFEPILTLNQLIDYIKYLDDRLLSEEERIKKLEGK